jgi:PII-like signaling protein
MKAPQVLDPPKAKMRIGELLLVLIVVVVIVEEEKSVEALLLEVSSMEEGNLVVSVALLVSKVSLVCGCS